jgi:aspartate kinase
MFTALAAEGINIKMITTSDIKISVLVNKTDGVKALRAVHQAFKLHESRPGAGKAAQGGKALAGRKPGPVVEENHLREAVAQAQLASMEDIVVSDVGLIEDHGRITAYNLPDRPGICSRVFQAVAKGGINVDLIVLNLPNAPGAELSFSVPRGDLPRALKLTQEVTRDIDPATTAMAEPNIAKVSVYGVGMRTHTGVARQMFGALAERGINISMINTSEVCVSVVVDRARGAEALACLKQVFDVR